MHFRSCGLWVSCYYAGFCSFFMWQHGHMDFTSRIVSSGDYISMCNFWLLLESFKHLVFRLSSTSTLHYSVRNYRNMLAALQFSLISFCFLLLGSSCMLYMFIWVWSQLGGCPEFTWFLFHKISVLLFDVSLFMFFSLFSCAIYTRTIFWVPDRGITSEASLITPVSLNLLVCLFTLLGLCYSLFLSAFLLCGFRYVTG